MGALLESVSRHGAENAAPTDAASRALLGRVESRLCSSLHGYQKRGLAWMAGREAAQPSEALHPAWLQVRDRGLHSISASCT